MGQARIVALVRQFEKLQSLVPAVEVPIGRRDIDGRSILMLVALEAVANRYSNRPCTPPARKASRCAETSFKADWLPRTDAPLRNSSSAAS
jgi:hypothetical protein